MMINAIDEQHFNWVHHLPVDLNLEPEVINENCILFRNTTSIPGRSRLTRFLRGFYRDVLTIVLSYWFGSTGTVTMGPDFQHFHIIFALRPTADGRSEGQTILVTRHRPGWIGRFRSLVLLVLTQAVSLFFAKGDTQIFKTIRFDFRTPIKADRPVISFIQHVELQRTIPWGLPVETVDSRMESGQEFGPETAPDARAQSMLEPEVAR
jgi:hypothetical protein